MGGFALTQPVEHRREARARIAQPAPQCARAQTQILCDLCEAWRPRRQSMLPWTTGAGIGFVLLDELYIGAEFKGHRYVVERPGGERAEYTTASIGPVIGWRYFIWRGLHANVYLRYWPNVWSSLDDDTHTFSDGEEHAAKDLQFFANISIGWAFDLGE